ncbi:MAG: hypothetical protein E7A24_07760 [Varibaculum cambriense]|nr:hypothetical protein [Varibaculum cambriense]
MGSRDRTAKNGTIGILPIVAARNRTARIELLPAGSGEDGNYPENPDSSRQDIGVPQLSGFSG